MPQVVYNRSMPAPRKTGVVIGVVLLAIVLTGAAMFAAWRLAVAADEREYASSKQQVEKAVAARDYDKGITAMHSYVGGNWPRSHLYDAYVYLGTLYEMKGDYKQALLAYRQAESRNPGQRQAEIEAIGRVSEQLGDKKTALAYYEKKLKAMQDGGFVDREDILWMQAKITKLKAAQ